MVALLVRASEKIELYWHIRTACKFIYKQIYKQFLTKPNNIKQSLIKAKCLLSGFCKMEQSLKTAPRAPDGNRTRTDISVHGILSPACLPIPPPERSGCKDRQFLGFYTNVFTRRPLWRNLLWLYSAMECPEISRQTPVG